MQIDQQALLDRSVPASFLFRDCAEASLGVQVSFWV